MPVLPWKQGVHGNKLTYYELSWVMTYCDLCTKYEVRSEELQTAKLKMYASVAMITTLPYQLVVKFIVIT